MFLKNDLILDSEFFSAAHQDSCHDTPVYRGTQFGQYWSKETKIHDE